MEKKRKASEVSPRIVVGYALTPKKINSLLKPNFIRVARDEGIDFAAIDLPRPLSKQGPFSIILHKIAGESWSAIIKDHKRRHQEVIVLDPPDAIQLLRNRQSMLELAADLKLPDGYGKVCIPRQLVISRYTLSVEDEVTKAGLQLPIVAKPLFADGSAKSHELDLKYDLPSLSALEVPAILQEFVNHGGVLFKVFIVGEFIKVVRRSSLHNVTKSDLAEQSGARRIPRVSSAAASADNADMDPSVLVSAAEHPPQPLLEGVAKELRHRLGLQLFNLDMIRESGSKDQYYIIDINYFPGYGKVPGYEEMFTNLLTNLVQSKC